MRKHTRLRLNRETILNLNSMSRIRGGDAVTDPVCTDSVNCPLTTVNGTGGSGAQCGSLQGCGTAGC
jgi:hypothetical protein